MGLFDLHHEPAPAPEPTPAPPADEPGFVVTIKNTRNGQPLMVCTVEPPPQAAIDQAKAAGLPLFGPSEIQRLAGADQATVDQAIAVKLTMPGASIESVTLYDGEAATP